MADMDPPADGPPVEELNAVFQVYETRIDDERLLYYGEPLLAPDRVERQVWPLFRERGYEVSLVRRTGEHVLVAEPASVGVDGIPWTNLVFFLLTVLSTLYAGTLWYHVELNGPLDLLRGWPFAVAILGVLGIHELGHYVTSRYYDVRASLPYFIPLPSIIGTMGAVIRMKGRMPDRRALFDIGVAGPLAGLAAAIVVSVVGLHMEPIEIPRRVLASPQAVTIDFNYPLLLQLIAWAVGRPLEYADPAVSVNPVVFGGWVGMFVTFLNLIPVGQLDGGHMVRAMLGDRQKTVAAAVPGALFGLAGYLYYVRGLNLEDSVGIWAFWGLFALLLAWGGPATPVRDEPLGPGRIAVGVLTFFLGLLCFTPVPFEVVT